MQAPDPAAKLSRDSSRAVSARAPNPHSSTSQAFHAQLSPAVVTRSLIVSAVGSTIGMVMFGVIQGSVFNFFLEDLNLKERIPWFAALLWLSGSGSLVGSWIQERWGHRRALMISCCGLSRLVWLFLGVLPLVWPAKVATGGFFWWVTGCVIFFYFVHSVGANAWLAWMSDLVPPEHSAKFWSLRQVATYSSNAAARLGFGWYLETHRNMTGYAIILGLASLAGVLDVATYFFVAHREPKRVRIRHSIWKESIKRLKESSFAKLCGVYLFWLAANCIMAPTVYYLMREHVLMGPFLVARCMTISMVGFAVSSLFWGRLGNKEGHRRAVIGCLIIQNSCTFFYCFCGANTTALATVASTLEQIGLGGVTLFMFPMVIDYTKGKGGGRAVGMAVFMVLLSVVGFGASIVADRHIYVWMAAFLNLVGPGRYTPQSFAVYAGIILVACGLRSASLFLALRLPPCEKQLAAGAGSLILRRLAEGPLRAAQSMFTSAVERVDLDEELEDVVGTNVQSSEQKEK